MRIYRLIALCALGLVVTGIIFFTNTSDAAKAFIIILIVCAALMDNVVAYILKAKIYINAGHVLEYNPDDKAIQIERTIVFYVSILSIFVLIILWINVYLL